MAAVFVSMSPAFIREVKQRFWSILNIGVANGSMRHKLNVSGSMVSPSAYIIAVAAVEAFVNELFLGDAMRIALTDRPLYAFSEGFIDRWDLLQKIEYFPMLAFGAGIRKDNQTWEDIKSLVRLRNELTHYKLIIVPEVLTSLIQRGIMLPRSSDPDVSIPWISHVGCSEGVRWAHNAACAAVRAIGTLVPNVDTEDGRRNQFWAQALMNPFEPITERQVRDWFKGKDVDVATDHRMW